MIRYLEDKMLRMAGDERAPIISFSSPPGETEPYELMLFQRTLTAADARRLRDWLIEVVPDETQIWRPKR